MENSEITLQDIQIRKEQIREQLQKRQKAMTMKTQALFSPPSREMGKATQLLSTIDKGIAVFDGLMLGLKVMRQVRRFFHR